MSAARNDGGPAFPMPGATYTEDCGDFRREQYHGPQYGMTLRDYFAAKAMPALIEVCQNDARGEGLSFPEHIAACAYGMADAMLKARQS